MIFPSEIYKKLEQGITNIDLEREALFQVSQSQLEDLEKEGTLKEENIPAKIIGFIETQREILKLLPGTISPQDLMDYHNYIQDKRRDEKERATHFAGAYNALIQGSR